MSLYVTFRFMRTAATPEFLARHVRQGCGAQEAITFITIPVPPSVNALYRNVAGRGRVKTAAYKDWAGHAGWVLKSQHPEPVPGRVVIVLGIERASAASDIDNRIKAIFDLLVAHKIIRNDNLVTAFATAWAPKGCGQARVAVLPAHDLTLQLLVAADAATGGWFIKPPHQEGPTEHGH